VRLARDSAYRCPVTGDHREQRVAEAFVELADTLVDDYDVLDFLHGLAEHCVDLLDVDDAGLVVADSTGILRVAASSSEQVRVLELFELQNEEGPCLECFRTGTAVTADDLDDPGGHQARFAQVARAAGFRSVVALPLRLRDQTIGALNMFRVRPGPLTPAHCALGQALADVATIGILQERGARRQEQLARQLQAALSSRIVIEQAKGVLAERRGVHVDEAFRVIRQYARSKGERLSEVASRVVTRELDPADLPLSEPSRDSAR
jgi:transcriptional regulator with GAF, ATPase, and Fis domain